MGNYLAFDLGASSGRAIVGRLGNGRLELQEVHRFANAPEEIDGSIYWNYPRLCAELKTGLRRALEVESSLDGIAIDTWGVDYVLFDRDTHAMKRLPYHYRDHRTEAAAHKLWRQLPPAEIYKMTGIQLMTLNTIYQLAAHRDEHPEDFENSVFLDIPDALALAFGGEFTTEYTHASTTNLLDPISRDWHWGLIDRIGLPRSIFPSIVSPCTRGGTLSAELQKELGCGPIPIIKIGSHDTASAVAAVPAPEAGNWAYLCTGTWALLGAELPNPFITADSEQNNFTNEGGLGGTIRFLTNIMGSWLFQETRRTWNESGMQFSFADMEKMAAASAPCAFFINPNDSSFAAPGDMPSRIRSYCRDQGEMTDAQVVRSIYDSLALYFKCKLETLAGLLNTSYAALNIVGGGTRDRLLMQLTADAANIPVITGPVEATATGNLLAQAIATGEVAGLSAARRIVRDSFEVVTYRPNPEMHAVYETKLSRFRDLTRK